MKSEAFAVRVSVVLGAMLVLSACDKAPGKILREAEERRAASSAEPGERGRKDAPSSASAGIVERSPAALRANELTASLHRKMMRGDGRGCLEDAAEVKRLDPYLEKQLLPVTAQCQMLAGECQLGKDALSTYYAKELAMGPERTRSIVESIASMRCREGDSTPRDRFLRAHQELTEGAYLEKQSPAFCEERVSLLRELGRVVEPRDIDDQTVSGAKQALFFTASACFARAGDCARALAIYAELFPTQNFGAQITQAMRRELIESSFYSSQPRCEKTK